METRNITVKLDAETIRRAKIAAARRDMSVSALLTRKLNEISETDERYEQAKRRAAELMNEAAHTNRSAPQWTREELHDR